MVDFNPDYSTPLCETIRECMELRSMDQMDVAIAMCESEPPVEREIQINYLVLDMLFHLSDENMKMCLSIAKGLERAFSVPALFWINRHENHRVRLHGE